MDWTSANQESSLRPDAHYELDPHASAGVDLGKVQTPPYWGVGADSALAEDKNQGPTTAAYGPTNYLNPYAYQYSTWDSGNSVVGLTEHDVVAKASPVVWDPLSSTTLSEGAVISNEAGCRSVVYDYSIKQSHRDPTNAAYWPSNEVATNGFNPYAPHHGVWNSEAPLPALPAHGYVAANTGSNAEFPFSPPLLGQDLSNSDQAGNGSGVAITDQFRVHATNAAYRLSNSITSSEFTSHVYPNGMWSTEAPVPLPTGHDYLAANTGPNVKLPKTKPMLSQGTNNPNQAGHGTAVTNSNQPRPQCSICSTTFKRAADLARHAKKHQVERPFQCSIHGCMFKGSYRKDKLDAHVRSCH